MADLIGSRQELLAHLILREKVFDSYPAVRQALGAVAKQHCTATPLFREELYEPPERLESAALMQSALAKFLEGEKERRSAVEALDDALRKRARSSESDVEHFGYHTLVYREDWGGDSEADIPDASAR